MGFIKSVGTRGSQSWLQRTVGSEAIQAMPTPAEMRERRTEEAEARSLKRVAEAAAENAQSRAARKKVEVVLDQANERFALARHALETLPIRSLSCFEQDELLTEAMGDAKRSLVITTAGLQPTMLTQYDLREIDSLTASRVAVHIGTFLSPQTKPRGGSYYDPLSELTKRNNTGPLNLYKTRRSAFFYLIKDDELAVISNRPFFGEIARRSGFQRVVGMVIRDRRRVSEIKELAAKACGVQTNG